MIISLNWLKKFVDIDTPIDELAVTIGARLVEIEEVVDLGAKYEGVLVVKVISCNKLESSDHLNVLLVDDGGVSNTSRNENGLIQVVCGASNIAADQFVVWLQPGSILPSTYGGCKPLKLESRELQGAISNGMIASAKELDLFDEHEGILVLDKDLTPGMSFAEAYELDDYLLDIENKSLTHRPDCFGIIGFAREISAIFGKPFKTPDWLLDLTPGFDNVKTDGIDLSVSIDDPTLSSRYMAVVMTEADGKRQSPLQIQTYLSRVGVRPISAVVDTTNYLMMLTGQPLHAFDYDKLVAVGGGSADIHVRAGHEKEQLELLDGRTIELTTDDIVIAAGKTAIGLAGAMGGSNTEIDENTKNIIIEAASFNLYNLRATQMRHGIFSEAITRFTKGQPADLTAPVLFDAVRLTSEWSGARAISSVADVYPKPQAAVTIQVSADGVNNILGSSYDNGDIAHTLADAEFIVEKSGDDVMTATVPYWRADIHIIEDISEEVGRLNGFDNIKPVLPVREFVATRPNDFDDFRGRLRRLLVRSGANEVLTYSFIHSNVMQKAGLDTSNSYQVINSISPDLQYYRQTLTPSLLDLVHPNVKQGYDNFALFEMNKTQSKDDGMTDEDVPVEGDRLSFVIVNKNDTPGSPYYQAKRVFDYICNGLGVSVTYEQDDLEQNHPVKRPFESRRSAALFDTNGLCMGVLGEYKRSVSKNFKLPVRVAGFDIDTRALFKAASARNYTPISRYPSAERDICFRVARTVNYKQLIDAAEKALQSGELEFGIKPIDIYQLADGDTKNITIRIRLVSHDHTLKGDEVAGVVNLVSKSVVDTVSAEVV